MAGDASRRAFASPCFGLVARCRRRCRGGRPAPRRTRRPRLACGDAGWSHSHGRLLIAYTGHGRLGVDIEPLARRADPLRIARRYFSGEEIAALDALDGVTRQSAFLRMWCAKEAVLKAHGGGIAFGLHKAVFDATGDGLRMLRCDPALGRVDDWRLDLLEPEPEFIAVLASTA